MSTFWTSPDLEPKRAFRFRIAGGDIGLPSVGKKYWWNAKKVDKPSFAVNSNKYRLINHQINVPGIVTWNPITIELADVGETINTILEDLGANGGYNPSNLANDKGIAKTYQNGAISNLHIEQLNGKGEVIEDWTLEGAFISDVKLSSLDYSSDEIISITLTITYDYAKLN
jgi:hypothetical protein